MGERGFRAPPCHPTLSYHMNTSPFTGVVARAVDLCFDADPETVTAARWKLSERIVANSAAGNGLLSEGNSRSVVAPTLEEAVWLLKSRLSESLTRYGVNPAHFTFAVRYSNVEDGAFWPELSSFGPSWVKVAD